MAKKSLLERAADVLPNGDIKAKLVAATIDGDFSAVITLVDLEIIKLEGKFPGRFSAEPKLSFAEMIESKRERRENLEQKGLMTLLDEGNQASKKYKILSGLRIDIEHFRNACELIRSCFGDQDNLNAALLKALNGKGIDELLIALQGKRESATSILPRDEDGVLPLGTYFHAQGEWAALLEVKKFLVGLRVVGRE